MKDASGWTPLIGVVEGGSVAVVQHLLAKEVKMDYKYKIVSESHPHVNGSLLDLNADTVILDYCRE